MLFTLDELVREAIKDESLLGEECFTHRAAKVKKKSPGRGGVNSGCKSKGHRQGCQNECGKEWRTKQFTQGLAGSNDFGLKPLI